MAFTIPNQIEFQSEITSAEHEQNYQAIQNDLNTEVIRRDGSVQMTAELQLAGSPSSPSAAATKSYVDAFLPIEVALPCFAPTAPAGWAFAVGQTMARSLAPQLAARIAADSNSPFWVDVTNFKLPDMRDRAPFGKGTGVLAALGATGGSKNAVVVSHGHDDTFSATQAAHGHTISLPLMAGKVGGFTNATEASNLGGNNAGDGNVTLVPESPPITVSGGVTASGVSGADKNLPPYMVCNWIMRLA